MIARFAMLTLCMLPTGGLLASSSTSDDAGLGRAVPNYNSDYAQHARDIPSAAGHTPEDNARPGEYYFRLAAEAFRRNDYAHAVKMYEVAASWAHKPAQFNLGVMYARGQGVPVDMPRAMAWMALAAERDDKEYVDAKEIVYGTLSREQFAQANVIWRELKKTYGDEIALARAKARWAEVRNNMTGSHVGGVTGPLLVGNAAPHGPGAIPMTGTTAGAVITADRADGTVAYRQLRVSDNPYDPKFQRPEIGSATVGALQPAEQDESAGKP